MKIKIESSLCALAFCMLGTGCLSDADEAARRHFAFDLAGDYDLESGTAALTIENQGDKSDVKLTIARSDFFAGEAPLAEHARDAAVRDALRSTIVLGDGGDANAFATRVNGGENVSTDFGATSDVDVSFTTDATPSVAGARNARLVYGVALHIDNGSDLLAGTLTATFLEEQPSNGKLVPHREDRSFDVAWQRRAGPLVAERCNECLAAAKKK